MARNLEKGEYVYVPRSRLDLIKEDSSAFYHTKVLEVLGRSVRISLPGGGTAEIGSSQVRRNTGVLLINVGDFESEVGLFNRIENSIYNYLSLLLEGDMAMSMRVRSKKEVFKVWRRYGSTYRNVVLIGHGSRDGIKFGVEGMVGPEGLADVFEEAGSTASSFISLCCKHGYADFSEKFSNSDVCDNIIAPFHTVHGAAASQFCQTLFSYHLLQGHTLRVAFKNARDTVPGSTSFRLWENGELKAGRGS